ncbi:MAG: hypothetical protein COZ75_04690 [Flavobacteriaceae bacterium CG_4_8_14_3_um_filter_34_10]|nr:MAG: hypothetical protein COS19_09380 [Flavobacteriaceae bacterium CG02_land_8_20_14_3_00_34_13]PIX09839.1 MAG: hypothetical protein COZ75_04690 [Flavobacteriaceae bacterium CG_4_8_14_3_um_filter_34_10]PIZ08104.1 MAG: hypothetical protein COY56_05525 [Flavobacteriaceae bacterium CG_4_10_14_0_8_um_filter_34_31]
MQHLFVTAFGLLPNLPVEDVFTTIIMAFIGALASFIASVVLRFISRWFGK